MDWSKNGNKKGLTHAPDEMLELKNLTLNKQFIVGNGKVKKIENFKQIYINDLIKKIRFQKKLKLLLHVVMELQVFLLHKF